MHSMLLRRGKISGEPVEPPPECERLWTADEVSAFLEIPVTTLH